MLGLPASLCYAYAHTQEAGRSKVSRLRLVPAGVLVDEAQLVVAA